jgi:DNA-binding MarR family transcriptional regulator
MTGRLQAELKQNKPFASLEVEAYLNVLRTADVLSRLVVAWLKPFDLTPSQYNVLRILRGAGAKGLPCGEIGARMVTHDPDVTRLIDRLMQRELVLRGRDDHDRRVVLVRITPAGLDLLKRCDVEAAGDPFVAPLARLGRDQVTALIDLLEAVRADGAVAALAKSPAAAER